MTSDSDIILIPDIESAYIISQRLIRGTAKQLIAAKGNGKKVYQLSLRNNISLQAAGYISRCSLSEIELARKQR